MCAPERRWSRRSQPVEWRRSIKTSWRWSWRRNVRHDWRRRSGGGGLNCGSRRWRRGKIQKTSRSDQGCCFFVLFLRSMKIYFHFLSFPNTKMAQVDKTLLNAWQGQKICLSWFIESIPWLLMTWWSKEPGHHLPWYWSGNNLLSALQRLTLCMLI